ncbi:MAG: hypothetical protein O2817_06645 [Proteobacteria bacterium]|nr:hypothetical protein [Pseudomonadota bacterium]
MTHPSAPTLRNAALDDAPVITEFLVRLGLVMPAGEGAIAEHWAKLWQDNPALKHHGDSPALGWILEDQDRIVGFFGNIPQVAYYQGKPVIVSSARAWAVDKDYRAHTPALCEAFFGQQNADLVLISSASAPAGKRCLDYGASKLPQAGYGEILYWVVDAFGFLRAGLKKKGRGAVSAFFGGLFASVVLNAQMRIMGRRPYAALGDITPIGVNDIGAEFDGLWQQKLAENPDRLLAARDAQTLKWYFGLSQNAGDTRILCARRDGKLEGYAVLVREDAPKIGLKRLKIADVFVAGDNPDTLNALLAAAYEYAMAKRCHVLELIGLAAPLRGMALGHKPYSRPMATFPFYFKALRDDLKAPLETGDGWTVTAYDGDTALL